MRGERGTSAPAAMNDTDYKLLDSVGEEEGLQSTRLRRTTIHEDAGVRRALLSEEYIWSYRNTIAFWAAILFQQGSVLFTIGSIALYPSILHVCDEGDKNVRRRLAGEDDCMPEFMFRAWVDYSFFIGAIAFTIGNYLVYFQVINSDKVRMGDCNIVTTFLIKYIARHHTQTTKRNNVLVARYTQRRHHPHRALSS